MKKKIYQSPFIELIGSTLQPVLAEASKVGQDHDADSKGNDSGNDYDIWNNQSESLWD